MATVTAVHQWADGSAVQVKVEVECSYPDALAEAKVTAVRGVAEMLAEFAERVEDE